MAPPGRIFCWAVYVSEGRYAEAAPHFAADGAVVRENGYEGDGEITLYHLGLLAWVEGTMCGRAVCCVMPSRATTASADRSTPSILFAISDYSPVRGAAATKQPGGFARSGSSYTGEAVSPPLPSA